MLLFKSVFPLVFTLVFTTLLLARPEAKAQSTASLSLQDKKDIVTAVVHAIRSPTLPVDPGDSTLTLTIDDVDAAQLISHVMSTYPKTQRFISTENRVERKGCTYDKNTGLLSMGIGVGKINPLDNSTAKVEAGSAQCLMGASGATYKLRKTVHGWEIVDVQENYII